MTAKSVNESASRLLANRKITARIEELRAPTLRRHEVSVDKTLDEIAIAAYGVVDDVLTWPAKLKALEMLARIGGLFERDNRQFAPNLAIQVNIVKPIHPRPAETHGQTNGKARCGLATVKRDAASRAASA